MSIISRNYDLLSKVEKASIDNRHNKLMEKYEADLKSWKEKYQSPKCPKLASIYITENRAKFIKDHPNMK